MNGSMVKAKMSQILTRNAEADDDDDIKITVRLDGPEAADLEQISKRLGMNRTAAASVLLEGAIVDAMLFLEEVDRDPDVLNAIHDPRTLRMLFEAARRQGFDLEEHVLPHPNPLTVQRAGEIVGEAN